MITSGEPLLHPELTMIIQRATDLKIKVMLVTNAGLLKPHRIRELAEAGLSSFIISIDAASQQVHERNCRLPGVCERIREANRLITALKFHATASMTVSRLVDYEALPRFLTHLGFRSVTFFYSNYQSRLRDGFLIFLQAVRNWLSRRASSGYRNGPKNRDV